MLNGVVTTDDRGKIVDISPNFAESGDIARYRGVLIPGFINAHCHLELSHMKGIVPTGTGLVPFIEKVVSLRNFPHEEILDAIDRADREMYQNGIVAVGDISNQTDTFSAKARSSLLYYTFVEMFDFLNPGLTEGVVKQYTEVYEAALAQDTGEVSLSPHSPYTVSNRLFQVINECNRSGVAVSIHNQETVEEHKFFTHKEGQLLDFFSRFGIDVDHFQPTGISSIHYTIEHLSRAFRTLMVHNTTTTAEDIRKAQQWNPEVYWVTCPNANLYIENRLPRYEAFLEENAKMCIGTDSLTSNWQLDILEEMKTIKRYQSYISESELILWATLNGAKALGFESTLGSLEVGKSPGINLLECHVQDGRFDLRDVSAVKRLI